MKFTLKKVNRNITRNDITEDLKRLAKQNPKGTLYSRQYRQAGKYAINTVLRHFGSWNNALKAAGLKITVKRGISKLELFQNLRRVWLTLGRQPMRKEMKAPLSEYPWRTYRRVFGSFAKALEEFVEFANRRRAHKLTKPFVDIKAAQVKNRTQRRVNYGLRYKVLTRDGYKCVKCGNSPAYSGGIRLQIDHIIPYSKGGETVIENLQTLCEACNLGKGNR